MSEVIKICVENILLIVSKKKKKDSTNRICIKIKLYTLNKIYNLCCVPIFY